MQKSDNKTANCFIKWAGGKRQLLPEIRKHVPSSFKDYFEPFVGGGAVFFDLRAAGRLTGRVTLGDRNAELVTTYKAVRDDIDGVMTLLRKHELMHTDGGENYYYAVRDDQYPQAGARMAARMIYLNKTCFNGIYRVNKKGLFNVPFGDYTKNPTICDAENLRACSRALKGAVIWRTDFEELSSAAIRGDFVYFDPPYVPVSATANFTSYTRDGFTLDDQERLATCAASLRRRGVSVLLSNADVPIIRKLYKDFQMREVRAKRNINSVGAKRGAVGELLIW